MGGPSAHGQKNKAHKAGRTAGKSAREKHHEKKDAGSGRHRQPIKAASASTKAERALASKQQRDAKRQQALERRRREGAPLVVALLPLSSEADAGALWRRLHEACSGGAAQQHGRQQQQQQAQGNGGDDAMADADAALALNISSPDQLAAALGFRPHTAVVQGRTRLRLTLLPPPRDRGDPLAYVQLGRCADVLLLALPCGEGSLVIDREGELALSVLRALGMPHCVGVVLCGADGGGGGGGAAAASMKERSAARRRAEKALAAQLPGELRLLHGDGAADAQQLLRHLADAAPQPPVWRRQRAAVLVQEAAFSLDPAGNAADGQQQQQQQQEQQQQQQQQQPAGTLRLTGYVRGAGLSANNLVTVPGAGDFQLLAIEGPPDPAAHGHGHGARAAPNGGDSDMADAGGGAGALPVLAAPDPELQDSAARENAPDPLMGEQTWPTDEELREAELAAAAAARAQKRRKLPPGTSDYQAAWIFDDMSGGESDDEEDEEAGGAGAAGAGDRDGDGMDEGPAAGGSGGGGGGGGGGGLRFDEEGAGADLDHLAVDDPGTDGMALDEEEEDEEEGGGAAAAARVRALKEEMRRQRQDHP
ncbi:hypothetical protein MNEG_2614 [Monoraphidium neglectum]|uniref:Bms1-type G domain-containing protein n=1 Tax=Monoraphidium neglectum TaxID=145388 RepID=A0A0D2K4H1_9CHLO|nr:hypothetical protein MNEG_2614 [Monoraphidium neglectum]KIZ05338.1 hypothetical protein MNEG_2614 [Monoraphidium neglectum]|eukprot:XP_013904357.1 hypothetical protein MNEG_2614 [Monoraphidium neglectum]